MSTKLQKILNEEGISKAALSKVDGLNPTTIHFLCKDPDYHRKSRELTKHNVLNAIKELGRNKKEYKLNEVFPQK